MLEKRVFMCVRACVCVCVCVYVPVQLLTDNDSYSWEGGGLSILIN